MTTPARRLALLTGLTAAMAAALVLPAGALAHGDPASHYLETDQLYPGFANRPSQALELQLLGLLEAARRDGYPIKVGIVGSPDDLTDDPSMFGRPQAYAEKVAGLLAGLKLKAPIVIVSPKGFGIAQPGTRTDPARLNARIRLSRNASGDDLALAAARAVRSIAAAAGHALPADIPPAKVLSPVPGGDSGGGIGSALPFLLFAGVFVSAWIYYEARTRLGRHPRRIPPNGGPHAQHRPD
jgi:hypothetical protein